MTSVLYYYLQPQIKPIQYLNFLSLKQNFTGCTLMQHETQTNTSKSCFTESVNFRECNRTQHDFPGNWVTFPGVSTIMKLLDNGTAWTLANVDSTFERKQNKMTEFIFRLNE